MLSANLEHYQQDTIPQKWLSELYNRKWFKLFIPKELGGLESDLTEGLKSLIYSATANGSLGWIHNLGSGAGYFCGYYSYETAKKLFIPKKAVIAGSGQVSGNAYKKDNGYIVEGTWDHCSGAAHATLFTVNALCDDGKVYTFTLYPNQVTLHNKWKAFGLKSTSSFSVEAKNCFVESSLVFEMEKAVSFLHYPLYQIPFDIFARFCLAATLIGILDCFLNQLINTPNLKLERINSQLIELKKLREQHEKKLLQLAEACWESVINSNLNEEEFGNQLKKEVAGMNYSSYQKACDIYYHAGLKLTNENELAHWAFRDIMTTTQHSLLK